MSELGAIVDEIGRRELAGLSDFELLMHALGGVATDHNKLGLESFEMEGATFYPVVTGDGTIVSTTSAELTQDQSTVIATRTAKPVTGFAQYIAVWPDREAAVYGLRAQVQPEDTRVTWEFGQTTRVILDEDRSLRLVTSSHGEETDASRLYARKRNTTESARLPANLRGSRMQVTVGEDATVILDRARESNAGRPAPGSVHIGGITAHPVAEGYTKIEDNRVYTTTNERDTPVALDYPLEIRVPEPGIPALAKGAVRQGPTEIKLAMAYEIGQPVVVQIPPTDDCVIHRLTAESLPWREVTEELFGKNRDALSARAPEIDRAAVLVALREAINAKRLDASSPLEPTVIGVRDVIKWLGNQLGVYGSRSGIQL